MLTTDSNYRLVHPLQNSTFTTISSWIEWLERFGNATCHDEVLNLLHHGFDKFRGHKGDYAPGYVVYYGKYHGQQIKELPWERIIFYMRIADEGGYSINLTNRIREICNRAMIALSQKGLALPEGKMKNAGRFLPEDMSTLEWLTETLIHCADRLPYLFRFFRIDRSFRLANLPHDWAPKGMESSYKRLRIFLLVACEFFLWASSSNYLEEKLRVRIRPHIKDVIDILVGLRRADILVSHWDTIPSEAVRHFRSLFDFYGRSYESLEEAYRVEDSSIPYACRHDLPGINELLLIQERRRIKAGSLCIKRKYLQEQRRQTNQNRVKQLEEELHKLKGEK